MKTNTAIITFSHLRWDFVYQRPQHLLTRLAKTHPVYFIEEPVADTTSARWLCSQAAPGVTVCRPATPCEKSGFDGRTTPLPQATD